MDGDALTRSKTSENIGNEFINVAPGEGQFPRNVLKVKNFDTKTFPNHFPDGNNGLNAERKRKLTYQQYFKQKLYNADKRFANDLAFLFSAVAYVEQMQLENNISMTFCHGSKSSSGNSTKEFKVTDPFLSSKIFVIPRLTGKNEKQNYLPSYTIKGLFTASLHYHVQI